MEELHSGDITGMMSHEYSEYESRPAPAGNGLLWVVHDEYMEKPEQRFADIATSPLANTIFSSDGPMSTSVIPEGLIKFIRDTCAQFHITECSQYVQVKDIVWSVFRYLDHNEPYYLFADSAVQLTNDNMQVTYRRKRNGEVFPPDRTEIFKVINGWDFKPFLALCDVLSHPVTQQILRDGFAPHPKVQNRTLTIQDTISQMSTILWGSTPPDQPATVLDEDGLDSWISDWMDTHYEHELWKMQFGPDAKKRVDCPSDLFDVERVLEQDKLFWKVCVLGILGWIRSPFAMKFLIEYHPVYQVILDWDAKTNHCVVAPKTGGIAIVMEWDIFTLQHVDMIQNEPPGTCGRCQQSLHCSKHVNVTALTRNDCSCKARREVDPLDHEFYNHDYDCNARRTANFQFACQKCLNELVQQRTLPKCERFTCGNTACPWHVGMQARLRELTRRRTLLLTQRAQ
jgi:hypothetical protein